VFAFNFIDDIYFDPTIGNGERTCTSLWHCYVVTINYGIRNGGGIGDTILP